MSFTAGDVTPKDWIRWMRLPNGKPPRLDMYGHNAFSTRIPRLRDKPFTNGNYDFSDLDTMESQLHKIYGHAYPSKFRKRGPRIWVSEFTIQADHGSQDFNFFVSKANQGRWISRRVPRGEPDELRRRRRLARPARRAGGAVQPHDRAS